MKRISEKVVKGKRRITVELDEGEGLMAVRNNALYKLGEPWEDHVIYGHTLTGASQTVWCTVVQKWVDV